MDAPPDKEDVGPFIRVADMLGAIGVNAPHILERNLEEGFLLLTDLGGRTYLKDLELGLNVDALYLDAMVALVRIQAGGRQYGPSLPAYDEALLLREMQLFPDWFLDKHLGLALDAAETATLQEGNALLAAEALGQPRTFVHRDYHSRNLMIVRQPQYGGNPGILDFQDAVFGPITYDLVSMLRDCYVAWPGERVAAWVEQYRHRARDAGLDVGKDSATFTRWFDWMGVQRHLKAIGIFARLWHRDGKPGYLGDIPRTLAYVVDVTSRYPQLGPLNRLLEARILPALAAVGP
jgi:aminoglycoside/choline kinase family phosphotransferase